MSWRGRITLLMAVLALLPIGCMGTGVRSFRERHPVESGFSPLIQSLPEPPLNWCEQKESVRPLPGNRMPRTWGGRGTVSQEIPEIPPRSETDPQTLPVMKPNGTEQGFSRLQTVDLKTATPAVVIGANSGPYRGITIEEIRTLAAGRANNAYRLELENQIPPPTVTPVGLFTKVDRGPECIARFMQQARQLAIEGDRLKSAGEAAGLYYQLADYEGRAELLRAGVVTFDQYRTELANFKISGRPATPPEMLAQIDRQRAQLLAGAEQLSYGISAANIQLKQQTGLIGSTKDRLYPTGDFAIDPAPVAVEDSVTMALTQRPDLQLLRLAYFELSADTLPAIRDQLRPVMGLMAPPKLLPGVPRPRIIATAFDRFFPKPCLDPQLLQELAVRKAQLYDLVCQKEREAADEVRLAGEGVNAAARLVAIKRSESELIRKDIDELVRKKAPKTQELQATMEWYKARAEVISAVMTWHQAQVKLKMARGDALP